MAMPTNTKIPMIRAGNTIGPRLSGPATVGTPLVVNSTSWPTKRGPRKATTKILVNASQIVPKIINPSDTFPG